MAHHGGPTATAPLPRAHRPRAPNMSVPAPQTAPLAPLRPPPTHHHQHQLTTPTAIIISASANVAGTTTTATTTVSTGRPTTPLPSPVTLIAPRPDNERVPNEYVETPFRPALPSHHHSSSNPLEKTPPPQHHLHLQQATRLDRPTRLPVPLVASSTTTTATTTPSIVTKQPVAFTKDHHPVATATAPGTFVSSDCVLSGGTGGTGAGGGGSVMCPQCGRCRCQSCRQPRPLPSKWLCDNACLCSADAVIDYASCLCCVKGLYYHCGADSDADSGPTTCADEPCSCGPHRWAARWACLGALAAVLPCLLCYWPLRGCARALEAAYARHSRAGCRCPPHPHHHQHNATTPEKRLLDSSPDF